MTTWLENWVANYDFVARGQCLDACLTFFSSNAESIFWVCGVFGTVLFLLKVMLLVLAGTGDDLLHHAGVDSHFDVVDHAAGPALKILSLGTLTGFFMMFGWVGLACLKQYSLSIQTSILIGIGAGLLLMVVSAVLFRAMLTLASGGSEFSVKKTIGCVGSVCQQIPRYGIGKVHLSIDGLTREVLARSIDDKPILSFTEIKVVDIVDEQTVLVTTKIS